MWGTQDMEFWKAYATYSARHGVATIYGSTDDVILAKYRSGLNFNDVVRDTQTVIPFKPYSYFREVYTCVQPPLYVYPLAIVGNVYEAIDASMTNRRSFNALINLAAIFASVLIALLLLRFAGSKAALIYWLNPLVILNSPVQGYLDPFVVLFTTASVLAVAHRRLPLAYAALTAAVLTKPQGVLIAPVIVVAGLLQHSLRDHVRAAACAALVALVAFAPFIATSHTLSVLQGVLTIEQNESALSLQALNLWWPVQYGINLAHGNFWLESVASDPLSRRIGLGLLIALTLANLCLLWRRRPLLPDHILGAAAVQVLSYFLVRVGVHGNHYFVVIALLAAFAVTSPSRMKLYIAISAAFIIPDLVFYGIGRDWTGGTELVTRSGLSFVTVILSFVTTGAFVWLWREAHRKYGLSLS